MKTKNMKINDPVTFAGFAPGETPPEGLEALTPGTVGKFLAIEGDMIMAQFDLPAEDEFGKPTTDEVSSQFLPSELGLDDAATAQPKGDTPAKSAKKKAPVKKAAKKKAATKKTSPPKKAEIVPFAPEMQEIAKTPTKTTLTQSVEDALAENKGDALEAAKRLLESTERTYYQLGGVLCYIEDTKAHESIFDENGTPLYSGKAGFEQWVEKELGIRYRKAKYLSGIYRSLTAAEIPEAKLEGIGWSKAKELVPAIQADPKEADKWLDSAKEKSTAEVKADVTKALSATGTKPHGNRKPVVEDGAKFRFLLPADQGDVVTAALAAAVEKIASQNGKPAETVSNSQAFAFIASEWLSLQ